MNRHEKKVLCIMMIIASILILVIGVIVLNRWLFFISFCSLLFSIISWAEYHSEDIADRYKKKKSV